MAKHPVTVAIDSAISWLESQGKEITKESVKANAKRRMRWEDWTFDAAADEALDARVARRLKDTGHVIADAVVGTRKRFWDAHIVDLEEQLRIKEESSTYDQNRILADRAVLDFLRQKKKDLGYEPYPGLFEDEINRIYAMQGLTAPGTAEAA